MNGTPWIETYSGRYVNPLDINPEKISIEDIAVPLSRLCRFTGQCRRFYSVGQHSVHVADLVIDQVVSRETALAALLHDAAEAYLNDVSTPIKHSVAQMQKVEQQLLDKIMQRFNCTNADWEIIWWADKTMLVTEGFWLMPSRGKDWSLDKGLVVQSCPPLLTEKQVVQCFKDRFYRLWG